MILLLNGFGLRRRCQWIFMAVNRKRGLAYVICAAHRRAIFSYPSSYEFASVLKLAEETFGLPSQGQRDVTADDWILDADTRFFSSIQPAAYLTAADMFSKTGTSHR